MAASIRSEPPCAEICLCAARAHALALAQGVYGLPKCIGVNHTICEEIRRLLDVGAYVKQIQENLVQAEYWQDPFNHDEYVAKNVFLADINNEGTNKNATYKQNLVTLDQFVMVKFLRDSMVQPRDSEWFAFYDEGQDKTVHTLQNSTVCWSAFLRARCVHMFWQLYTEDWIGMRTLDEAGKLLFLSVDGDHLQFTDQWFETTIVPLLEN